MSSKASPNVDLVKLRIPIASSYGDSGVPSYQEIDPKSRKGTRPNSISQKVSQQPQQGRDSTNNSSKKTQKSQSRMSEAKGKTLSKSPLKTLESQRTVDTVKIANLSRTNTTNLDRSPTRNARNQSPTNKKLTKKATKEIVEEKPAELSEAEVQERLYKVFQYYTTFGERNNVGYLKSHRFSKMMVDAEVRNDALNQSSLDLLFVGELKHSGNLNFDRFLGLLQRVAKVKYEEKELEAPASLDLLYKEHMFPLYDKIFKDGMSLRGGDDDEEEDDTVVEEGTKMIFDVVDSTLQGIFNMYFPFELQMTKDPAVLRQRMENALFMFLRDFDLCPALVSKGAAYAAWSDVMREPLEPKDGQAGNVANLGQTLGQSFMNQSKINTKAKGKVTDKDLPFNFERFKKFLVRISGLANQAMVQNQSMNQNQSFYGNQSFSQYQGNGSVLNQDSFFGSPTPGGRMGRSQFQGGASVGGRSPSGGKFGRGINGQNPNQGQTPFANGMTPIHGRGATPFGQTPFNGARGGMTPFGQFGQTPYGQNISPIGFGNMSMMTTERKANQQERTTMLLERMDMAFRTMNTEKKKAAIPSKGDKGSVIKQSLLVSQEAINKINNHLQNQESFVTAGGTRKKKGQAKALVITSGTKYQEYNIEDEDLIRLFEKHYTMVIKVFQYYSSFGEPLNTTRLHAMKFIKLLKEAGLLHSNNGQELPESGYKILQGLPPAPENQSISIAEADIIMASLTGPKQINEVNAAKMNYDTNVETPFIGQINYLYKTNLLNLATQGRLEYEAFLKSIEMISKKLYPDTTTAKAAAKIIENHIFHLEQEINQIQKSSGSKPLKVLVDLLQDMQIVEFLGVVHKSMMLYYKFYADKNGMMNIEKFMQFCRDFGVFPHLLTKQKLCTFFHALAGVRAQAEQNESRMNQSVTINLGETANSQNKSKQRQTAEAVAEEEVIDQHMFVEALAVIALDIPYLNPQPSEIEKIFNLMEKLNHSEGTVIVRKQLGSTRTVNGLHWDIMHEFRVKYPEMFVLEEEETEEADKANKSTQQWKI